MEDFIRRVTEQIRCVRITFMLAYLYVPVYAGILYRLRGMVFC